MKPILLIAAALVAAGTAARADDDEQGFGRAPANPTHQAECGACHLAYPAGFLPAPSWAAIMAGLSDHFGEDASLPAAQAEEIGAYLARYAGRAPRGMDAANPPLRISDLPWFTDEHGRRLVAKAKADPKIATMANCQGCHAGAADGRFEDD
jgi:nitrate/TMAO reductase-like tetraheme cytochrome c subunit